MEIKLFEEAETLKFQIEENEQKQNAYNEWMRQIKEGIRDASTYRDGNNVLVGVSNKSFINLLKRELNALKKNHIELTAKFKSL